MNKWTVDRNIKFQIEVLKIKSCAADPSRGLNLVDYAMQDLSKLTVALGKPKPSGGK